VIQVVHFNTDANVPSPLDSNGNVIPDSLQGGLDTDNEGILDRIDLYSYDDTTSDRAETHRDSDNDAVANNIALDSDNDGVPDATEAGDWNLDTPPVSCANENPTDGRPNYLDIDSDDDEVADGQEVDAGMDICNGDSDGDGIRDLLEWAF